MGVCLYDEMEEATRCVGGGVGVELSDISNVPCLPVSDNDFIKLNRQIINF